jgi:hypothetical protein
MSGRKSAPHSVTAMKTLNLKDGMPLVHQAISLLERELAVAQQSRHRVIKLIHGYGSSGVGGEIRIAVQKRLHEMKDQGLIQGFIFGENWTQSDEQSWKLIKIHPDLKNDRDYGRNNPGITVVLL